MKYFSYSHIYGHETHNTAEEAKKAAQDAIDSYRDQSDDGWDEEVEHVCWGEIKESATMTDKREPTEEDPEGFDFICDYELA